MPGGMIFGRWRRGDAEERRAFELALGTAGLPIAKVNPRQARRFSDAVGTLAQTDRLGSAMLTRFDRDDALEMPFAAVKSIPGIARLTIFAPPIEMREHGTIEARQAASLAPNPI